MKTLNKYSVITSLLVSLAFGLTGPIAANAATAPTLGALNTFGVVSDTFTNGNTALETAIIGNVCYTTGPATAPVSVSGTIGVGCPGTSLTDQNNALTTLNDVGQGCVSLGSAINLDNVTGHLTGVYTPGCYSSTGAMNITVNQTVTLSGQGVYIFKPGDALTSEANTKVVLINGANANDVYWVPVGGTTLGANSSTSATPTFVGNIFRGTAAGLSITLGKFVNLLGRTLAFNSTVTTDSNTITVPTTLRVVKLVVGGSAVASDFTIHVKKNGVDVGTPLAGAAAPGTNYALASSTYVVSEDANSSYTTTFTGTGCDSSGNVTLATGDDKTCTIVNTAVAVAAAAVPGVPTSVTGRYVPVIGITKVPTPLALSSGAGSVTYNYTVWNVGGMLALKNVSVKDDKCSPVTLVSGDINNNGKLDLSEHWKYTCTTTLSKTTTNTAVVTGYGDDGYNQAAIATAIATVVVGGSTPAPLINIVKVPSRLTPFPVGGGNVTYTYTVTNPGVVAMTNVIVTDNKCGPVSYVSGDTNGNKLLDTNETWTYTCNTNITASTMNTATAEGRANGFIALGYAFSTVLVAAPGLPNTGFPGTPWDIAIPAAIVMAIAILIIAVLKKRTV